MTLLEYVDFQCPCCQGSYPAIEGLVGESRQGLRFAVRQFPVNSAHPQAEQAARAAEAAGRQGKFWEMYHLLLRARGRLGMEQLEAFARALDLDPGRFHADVKGEAVTAKLKTDKWSGLRSGVNATPTLFLNGVRYGGAVCPVSADELREALEAARREAAEGH